MRLTSPRSTSRYRGFNEEFPTFNKVFACAWAERELEHETLVFLDTDSVFLNEPTELLEGDWVAAARPVDRRIAGSRGKGKNEPFWQRMYEALDVKSEAVRRDRGRQHAHPRLLEQRPHRGEARRRPLRAPGSGRSTRCSRRTSSTSGCCKFMDQISWAGASADSADRIRTLSNLYNYPLRQRGGLPDEARDLDLDEIVQLHYRLYLHLPDPLAMVEPPFDSSTPQHDWLAERLPIQPIVDEA